MSFSERLESLGECRWLAPVERAMTARAELLTKVGGETLETLQGDWLGNPLHLALSDVPLGAWTAAMAMDAVDALEGEDKMAPGAEMAIGVGLAGAAGAALTGLADWGSKTDPRERRMGVVHGVLSGSASLLFLASLALRKTGSRPEGRLASLAGFGIAVLAGATGGRLTALGEERARR